MKNKSLKNLFREEWYSTIKYQNVKGRYLTNKNLQNLVKDLEAEFSLKKIGSSVEGRDISYFTIGTGDVRILAWSQMHGNESTTTKAVFDLLWAFKKESSNPIIREILKQCTIRIIPILNPDGAKKYTRSNANLVDLNRDLQELSQPETKVLMKSYNEFKPDFCLNLHDQRTIFSAGNQKKPATLSFLTPSKDEERTIDKARKISMALIAAIAEDLNEELPEMIGRYDDVYNINCAGDTFQRLSTPTLLFEAGHYPDDYQRENVRKYVLYALISCLYSISKEIINSSEYQDYFKIPENKKLFYDIVIRNAILDGKPVDVGLQYKEIKKKGMINFIPQIAEISSKIEKFGHKEIFAEEKEISLPGEIDFIENVVVNKILLNNKEIRFKVG